MPGISKSTLSGGLLQHIIDHTKDAVLVVSPESLTLVDVDQHACRMLGYSRDQLQGCSLEKVECALQDIFFWEDLKATPVFEGSLVTEGEWLASDGRSFPVEKRVSSYSEAGQHYWVIHAEDITGRRQTQEDQVHLVSQMQSLLEATAEGVLEVDLNGRVINLNRRFTSLWKLSDDVLAARRASEMFAFLTPLLHDADAFFASLKQAEQEPEIETEDMLSLVDGRFFVCVSKPEYLRDHLVGRVFSVRDITAMKLAERDLVDAKEAAEKASQEKTRMLDALKVSESRLRRVLNSNLIGIMQGDMSGRLTDANPILLQLAGVSREDLNAGQLNWLQMTPPASHYAHQQALEEVRLHGQSASYEGELIRRDGVCIPVMMGLAQLDGSHVEWVGFVLDLTEQRKADRLKAEFISVVSHELRTPLTSIRGALGLLESGVGGELPSKAMQLIKIAHKNSQRLGTLVNDILDMEKLASGNMVVNIERLDLVALTRQALEANAAYAQALHVRYHLSEHPPHAWAMGDSARVMQVFANLLSNAAKFSPAGEVVDVQIVLLDDAFRIEIKDHGVGIPLAFQSQIFKKFAQADSTNTRQQGGTGLGLNITKTFVEKMGGEIGFDSKEGQGTTFWFTLLAATRRRDDG
ncbi:PAS domain S-box protein [Undibacterium sp. SXout7W]|uniref:PAS domain S-box protein n=1 Tax=Undibacterium sp. SXout7W TaxID=3413049 RepID=UPI003BF0AB05